MGPFKRWTLSLLTLAILACADYSSAQEKKAAPEAAAPPAGTWRSYPIGSYARIITKTTRESGDNKVEEVWDSKTTLVELTKTGAVLEMERTYKGSTSKEKQEMPYDSDSMLEQLTAAWTASKGGSETLTIGKQKIECKVIDKAPGSNQIAEKIWFSGEVPGNVVRTESHFAGPANIKLDAIGQVTEFKGKKPATD